MSLAECHYAVSFMLNVANKPFRLNASIQNVINPEYQN
jgi:hypothetical protein